MESEALPARDRVAPLEALEAAGRVALEMPAALVMAAKTSDSLASD